MSEQVNMVEVETEPNESDELHFDCNNTNIVDNHSRNDKSTSNSEIILQFVLN